MYAIDESMMTKDGDYHMCVPPSGSIDYKMNEITLFGKDCRTGDEPGGALYDEAEYVSSSKDDSHSSSSVDEEDEA